MRAMSYKDTMQLVNRHHIQLTWDKRAKLYYAIFMRDWLNEYLFIEDEKSFLAQYALVKKYKLRGISVFDLGTEDSRIWRDLR